MLAYVAATAPPWPASDAAWDEVYINGALERELRPDARDAPSAVALVALPSAAPLSRQARLAWARPAPPEWDDGARPAVYVPGQRESGEFAVRAVAPVPLSAAYVALPSPWYEQVAQDQRGFLASLHGHLLRAGAEIDVHGAPVRVLLAEPVAQGAVSASSTALTVVRDTRPPRPPPAAEAPDVALALSSRYLGERSADAPAPTLTARALPSAAPVRAALAAWRARTGDDVYVDEESVVMVQERTLAALGVFDGDWVVASVLTSPRARVVRVLALSHGAGVACGADEALVPPCLLPNLVQGTYDPLGTLALHLEPLPPNVADEAARVPDAAWRAAPAQPPLMPRAESMTLAAVASPLTTSKTYEAQCADALRRHFAAHPRILSEGDLIGVAIDAGHARFWHVDAERAALSDDVRERAARVRLPGLPTATARHAVFYSVETLTPALVDPASATEALAELPALREWYVALAASGSLAGAGCWVDAQHTKIVQQHVVQRRVVDVAAWLALRGVAPVCPPDATPLTQAGSAFARLASLVHAAVSPAARRLHVQLSVLLEGPAGVGKRTLVHWVAQRTGTHLYEVEASALVGDSDTHTEGALRARCARARACGPCVLLLRSIDVLVRRSGGEGASTAVLKMVQRCLADGASDEAAWPLILVATTDDAERCPAALRALFNETMALAPPNEAERAQCLSMALAPYDVSADVDVRALAVQSAALLAADLVEVVERARLASVQRACGAGADVGDVVAAQPALLATDLGHALEHVRASYSESIGAPKIPNVTWDDVGGLASVKHEILDTVQLPLEHPELFTDGVKKRSGILLYGPPGTGKTLLAKAVATTCALNFFSVKGPELLNMYIGESEANVRRVFQKARDAKPCVIFFDELDSIAPKRGNQGDSGGVMDRIVSQLLAELDGMASGAAASDVFVIGATNRPDLLDPALLRPGRFDRLLYLSVAESHDAQLPILQALTRKFVLDDDVGDLRVIAEQCPLNLTGADFYALCSDAMLLAMTHKAEAIDDKVAQLNKAPRTDDQQHWPSPMTPQFYLAELASPDDLQVKVGRAHFEQALRALTPSVSEQEMAHYRQVQRQFSQPDDTSKNAAPTPAPMLGDMALAPGATLSLGGGDAGEPAWSIDTHGAEPTARSEADEAPADGTAARSETDEAPAEGTAARPEADETPADGTAARSETDDTPADGTAAAHGADEQPSDGAVPSSGAARTDAAGLADDGAPRSPQPPPKSKGKGKGKGKGKARAVDDDA